MDNFALRLPPDERELLARAAEWPGLHNLESLSPDALLAISRSQGIDVATALAYDRLRRSAAHAAAIEELDAIDPQLPLAAATPRESRRSVLLVPGAFHKDRAKLTGADGLVVVEEARRLGYAARVAPTRGFGSLAKNAAILRDWLSSQDRDGAILVSLSKGTAELKWLLREYGSQPLRNVTAWVSLSGVWFGTPLVEWLLRQRVRSFFVRLLLAWRGHDFHVIRELGYGPGQLLAADVRVPEHVRMLHVVGFPLVQHLSSPLSRRGHRRLSEWGPNDAAGLLLADAGRLPGTVYPVWGADHYLRPHGHDNRLLVRRVLLWLARSLDVSGVQTAEASA